MSNLKEDSKTKEKIHKNCQCSCKNCTKFDDSSQQFPLTCTTSLNPRKKQETKLVHERSKKIENKLVKNCCNSENEITSSSRIGRSRQRNRSRSSVIDFDLKHTSRQRKVSDLISEIKSREQKAAQPSTRRNTTTIRRAVTLDRNHKREKTSLDNKFHSYVPSYIKWTSAEDRFEERKMFVPRKSVKKGQQKTISKDAENKEDKFVNAAEENMSIRSPTIRKLRRSERNFETQSEVGFSG